MNEPASVLAARQLARGARAAVVVTGLGAVGCSPGAEVACPAVAYGSVLTVQLADGWPTGVDRQVEFVCDPACPSPVVLEEAQPAFPPSGAPGPTPTPPQPADPVVAVDPAGRAELGLLDVRLAEVTVRVLEAGVVVAELTVDPEFVRVGGTAECGGPMAAEVVVPEP